MACDPGLASLIKNCIQEFGTQRTYWVGFSGGRDSHVLLHLLAQLREEIYFPLQAIHINHSLSPHAVAWSEHCARVCFDLKIPFQQFVIDAKAGTGESPEAIARQKRYAVLAMQLAPQDILLTAHHEDDQAETFLLQLMRGAGAKGLAAMPRVKNFGQGLQVRPLLTATRAEITEYATTQQLQWIEDESNQQITFSRNFIRQKVMPLLQQRWPAATTTIARSAENCALIQQLADDFIETDLAAVQGSVANTLSVSALLNLSFARQHHVLRYWLQQQGFMLPSLVKLRQVQHDMLMARDDRVPVVRWAGVELRRFRNNLYALQPLTMHDATQIVAWDLQQELRLQGVGVLQATVTAGNVLCLRADIEDVTVRFRQGGEILNLPGRGFRHDLKKLFQQWQVPTWQRDRVPLIYVGERLAAVVGWGVDREFVAAEEQEGYSFHLAPHA